MFPAGVPVDIAAFVQKPVSFDGSLATNRPWQVLVQFQFCKV
jgi:hypothetical protein